MNKDNEFTLWQDIQFYQQKDWRLEKEEIIKAPTLYKKGYEQ